MWNIPASTTNATCRSWNGSRDPHEVRLKRREINWHYDRKAEAWLEQPRPSSIAPLRVRHLDELYSTSMAA